MCNCCIETRWWQVEGEDVLGAAPTGANFVWVISNFISYLGVTCVSDISFVWITCLYARLLWMKICQVIHFRSIAITIVEFLVHNYVLCTRLIVFLGNNQTNYVAYIIFPTIAFFPFYHCVVMIWIAVEANHIHHPSEYTWPQLKAKTWGNITCIQDGLYFIAQSITRSVRL